MENIYEIHSKLLNADEKTFTERELVNFFYKYSEILLNLAEPDYTSVYCELAIINEVIFLFKSEKINEEASKVKSLIDKMARLLTFFKDRNNDLMTQYSKAIIGISEKIAEKSEELSQYLANSTIFQLSLDFIKSKILLKPIEDTLDEDSLSLYDRIIFFIFKISSHSINKEDLRALKISSAISDELETLNAMIKKYENLKKNFEINKSRLAFIIVRMLDENEVDKLTNKNEIVETIVQLLIEIIESSNEKIHFNSKFYIFYELSNLETYVSASFQLQQLITLASNDQLKEKIFSLIGFDKFMKLITYGNSEELQYCLELLASLCFNEKIKNVIKNNFYILKHKLDEREKNSEIEKFKFIIEKKNDISQAKSISVSQSNNLQIMISYNHKYKNYCKSLHDELKKRGYKTWFDLERMTTNIIDGMANAVETSAVILVCYSNE